MAEMREAPGRRPASRPEDVRNEVSVLLDAEELAELDTLARTRSESRSDLIRAAVRQVWLQGRPTKPN
jgi:metal-responsive CopG/Arc/MetJ family transcriptional regulator